MWDDSTCVSEFRIHNFRIESIKPKPEDLQPTEPVALHHLSTNNKYRQKQKKTETKRIKQKRREKKNE